MEKEAPSQHPINDLIKRRWSPRAFSERLISDEDLLTMLDAARWAPSCYNDQPWFFVVAKREEAEEFGRMVDCLVPANEIWAKNAAVLMLAVRVLHLVAIIFLDIVPFIFDLPSEATSFVSDVLNVTPAQMQVC